MYIYIYVYTHCMNGMCIYIIHGYTMYINMINVYESMYNMYTYICVIMYIYIYYMHTLYLVEIKSYTHTTLCTSPLVFAFRWARFLAKRVVLVGSSCGLVHTWTMSTADGFPKMGLPQISWLDNGAVLKPELKPIAFGPPPF